MKEIADNYALDIVMDKYSAFHAITFHSRVAFADDFAKRHNNFFSPDVYAQHVSGQNTTSRRAKVLTEFKLHQKAVVSNARCLTEGVDVPIIDMIYFCDPKNSKIDIVQASGRALRKDKHGKKPIGYIVVPIYHHIDEDIEKEIEKKPYFQNLIQVIRSLCDQDERLQAEIDEVAFNKGEKTFRRIEITYDDSTIEKIIKLDGIDKEVKKYLFDEIIEKTKDNWNVMYAKLVEFSKIYNTTNVTRKYKDYDTLRWWVQAQRDNYFKQRLSSLQIKKLNKINFEWKGDQRIGYLPPDEKWKKNYEKLKNYFEVHSNVDIPARYEKDKPLANWVVDQRVRYDNGRLSDEQIELLEAVKINWDPKNTYPEFIEALIKYKSQFGTPTVPQGIHQYRHLAAKSSRLRSIYRYGQETKRGDIVLYGKGRITKWAIEKLKELNFEWDVTNYPEWNERFEELKKIYEENGHANVTALDNQKLFYWCIRQRNNQNNLEPNQIQQLQSLKFTLERRKVNSENLFLDKLTVLEGYYNDKQKAIETLGKNAIRKIQKWESEYRNAYKRGELKEDYFSLLISIGFSFEERNLDEEIWETMFQSLKNYYADFGVFEIGDEPDFKRLRNWIRYQRTLHNKNQLKEERVKKLVDAGYSFAKQPKVVSNEIREKIAITLWEKKFNEIRNLISEKESLHAIEEVDNKESLLRWIEKVIREFKSGKLKQDRLKKLREINFDFQFKRIRKIKVKHDDWQERFNELKDYFERTNTFYLSRKNESQKKLSSWVRLQKFLYQRGRLKEDRIKQLLEAV